MRLFNKKIYLSKAVEMLEESIRCWKRVRRIIIERKERVGVF
jgi:hypothetical protein